MNSPVLLPSLSPVDESTLVATIDAGAIIGDGASTGLLSALACAAADVVSGPVTNHPDPLTAATLIVSPTGPGPLYLRAKIARSTPTRTSAHVVAIQQSSSGHTERFRSLLTMGNLRDGALDPNGISATPVEIAPVEECLPITDLVAPRLTRTGPWSQFEVLLDPATTGWARGEASTLGQQRGWLRPQGGDATARSLLQAVDAVPPVAWDLGGRGWAPASEMTTYVRRLPASGWLRFTVGTSGRTANEVQQSVRVWDSADALVAESVALTNARF